MNHLFENFRDLFKNPEITDILINGPNDLWIDRGRGLEKIHFSSDNQIPELRTQESLNQFAHSIALYCDERLDEAVPFLDAKIESNIRVNIAIFPTVKNVIISFRIPKGENFTLTQLVQNQTIEFSVKNFLEQIVLKRKNLLISGNTGSGKTTLLKTLIDLIPQNQRIITFEEFPELSSQHPHFVNMYSKRKNVEGKGEIKIEQLIKNCLRMRPDRLILGEIRGEEIKELFLAFSSGHRGGFSTIHAQNLEQLPQRLMTVSALAGLSKESVILQTFSSFDYFLHMERSGGNRKLVQIGIPKIKDNELSVQLIFNNRRGSKFYDRTYF